MPMNIAGIRWWRVAVAVIVGEVIPLAVLVAAVAVMSRGSHEADQALAMELGSWVGPIGGFVVCSLMSWWAGRPTPASAIGQGLMIGMLLAVLDVLLLFTMGETPWHWLIIASNGGKIVAGLLGGVVASQRKAKN